MNYYGIPSTVFAKLKAQECPYLICDRHCDVVILNVRYIHWQFIQGSQRQSNPDFLP